jgi:hypothetical protein
MYCSASSVLYSTALSITLSNSSRISRKIGRIHLGKQDIEKMNVKKAKAIKRKSDVGKDKDGKPTKRVKTGAELESYEERSSNV